VKNPNTTRRGHYFARAIEREAGTTCRTGGRVADGLRMREWDRHASAIAVTIDAPDFIAAGSVSFPIGDYVPLMTAIERGAA
jgi:hypothetical protein